MKTLKIFITAILLVSFTALAQNDDVQKYPGYFDFGDLGSLDDGDEGAEIFIEEHLLKMVSKLSNSEDKSLSDLLSGLKLIKVNTFSVSNKNEKNIKDRLTTIQNSLKSKNWDRIVRVREKGEEMNVYLKTDKNSKINGLVVAGFEKGGDAVFINIVGNIDLETIGKLTDKFDIPSLDELSKNKKK